MSKKEQSRIIHLIKEQLALLTACIENTIEELSKDSPKVKLHLQEIINDTANANLELELIQSEFRLATKANPISDEQIEALAEKLKITDEFKDIMKQAADSCEPINKDDEEEKLMVKTIKALLPCYEDLYLSGAKAGFVKGYKAANPLHNESVHIETEFGLMNVTPPPLHNEGWIKVALEFAEWKDDTQIRVKGLYHHRKSGLPMDENGKTLEDLFEFYINFIYKGTLPNAPINK